MDLYQCVTPTFRTTKDSRQVKSEERQVTFGGHRRISLPAGHYPSTIPNGATSRGASPAWSDRPSFRHYGSSLSLSNKSVASELCTRTLRPPSPTVLKKLSTSSMGSTSSRKSSRPPLPNPKVEINGPNLEDYLDQPRLVSTLNCKPKPASNPGQPPKTLSKRDPKDFRNLRLGNFMENSDSDQDEIIPEQYRQYYLDTFLNVCDTCDSRTHNHLSATPHRGM